MEKWRGKIAVVVGASSGIGAAILKDLAAHGIIVIGLARRSELIDEIEGKIYARKCDASNLESIKETFAWIEEKFGAIHILVNNAAILHKLSVFDVSEDAADKLNSVINTNFTGVVHTTREGVRLMRKSDDFGIIINVNSIAGHSVYAGLHISNLYSPTKYALTAFSEIVRQELIVSGSDKIRVSNLSPGVVKTNIMISGKAFESAADYDKVAHLQSEDISQGLIYLLETPYNVNVTQLTIKPVGETK